MTITECSATPQWDEDEGGKQKLAHLGGSDYSETALPCIKKLEILNVAVLQAGLRPSKQPWLLVTCPFRNQIGQRK